MMTMIKDSVEYEKSVDEAVEYYNKKDYNNSLEQFLLLADYNNDNLKVHEMLVYNYLNLNRFEEAENQFNIYLKLAKENNITLELRSFDQLIDDLGDEKTIKEEYDSLLAKDIKNIDFIDTKKVMHMGFVYMSQREFKKAESILSNFKGMLNQTIAG